MKIAALLATLVTLYACAPQGADVGAASVGEAIPASAAQACAPPGSVIKVCRRQTDRCVTPYRDAGERCTDNAECDGDCLLKDESKPEGNVGFCQKDDNPCGCRISLVKGKVDRSICVD